jgi:hypothetical protein
MITSLASVLERYPGQANHVRCFAHILNLVVKVILRQFDAPKKKKAESAATESEKSLAELTKDIKIEEMDDDDDDGTSADAQGRDEVGDGVTESEIEEVLPAVKAAMAGDEKAMADVQHIRLFLTKVRVVLYSFAWSMFNNQRHGTFVCLHCIGH